MILIGIRKEHVFSSGRLQSPVSFIRSSLLAVLFNLLICLLLFILSALLMAERDMLKISHYIRYVSISSSSIKICFIMLLYY